MHSGRVIMIEPRFNETIHPRNRLHICAILADTEAIDFPTLRETMSISESSLSKHIKYLSEAGYVTVAKARHHSRTRTWLSLSKTGRAAYDSHLEELRRIAGLSAPVSQSEH